MKCRQKFRQFTYLKHIAEKFLPVKQSLTVASDILLCLAEKGIPGDDLFLSVQLNGRLT